jgi:putative tryptophan/tyrosine transport system substrate-binding protein
MRRRVFIAGLGSAAAWPAVAEAQQGGRLRRVGCLTTATEAGGKAQAMRIHDELRKLGWIEGKKLQFDLRFGAGDADRTRAYALELASLAPDAIIAAFIAAFGIAVRAAQQQA